MAEEPKYSLQDFTPEEAKSVTEDIDAALLKHSGALSVSPIINPNGTIGAKVEVFKKVKLVPESVPSPYANGQNPGEEPEASKAD